MDKISARNSIFDKVAGIPTFDSVLARLMPLLRSDDYDVDAVHKVISFDVGISTRLLKVANSAFYGFMQEIKTVRQAITVLGFRQVKSLALGITVFSGMHDIAAANIDMKSLWLHSIACAMAARGLGLKVNTVDAETAFTAGLLHDMGKIPLSGLFQSEYEAVHTAVAGNTSAAEAELRVFGFEHGEVGGWLCELWKLPRELLTAIKNHHRPLAAVKSNQALCAVVQCADAVANMTPVVIDGSATPGTEAVALAKQDNAGFDMLQPSMDLLGLQDADLDSIKLDLMIRKPEMISFIEALN